MQAIPCVNKVLQNCVKSLYCIPGALFRRIGKARLPRLNGGGSMFGGRQGWEGQSQEGALNTVQTRGRYDGAAEDCLCFLLHFRRDSGQNEEGGLAPGKRFGRLLTCRLGRASPPFPQTVRSMKGYIVNWFFNDPDPGSAGASQRLARVFGG